LAAVHRTSASRLGELANFINDSLLYYLDLKEELEMLAGSGVSPDLNGLIPQAAAFDTSLLSPSEGWTRIDLLGAAIEQIDKTKEIPATFAIVNPVDWWRIRRTKDSLGRYILSEQARRVWDLDIISTNNITAGTFLVGSGNPEATVIRDRMEAVVEVSNSHSDFFVKNKIAVRAEKRVALVTRRPNSFVYGSFTTSPA
jgi:HK97 family phage major capsid protein